MKRLWTATMVAALLICNSAFSPAFSQVDGVGSLLPGITSPLGVVPGASVPPTGIPLGATELASPGLSPLSDGTTGMAGFGTTCSASGSPSSGTGVSTYDGGGMGLGMGASLAGSGAICGASSSGSTSSIAAMSSTASGNIARTGIPFGSVEIGNAGVSPLVVVPTPSASSSMMGTLGPSPSTTIGTPSMLGAQTMPSVTGTAGLSTNQSAMPCGTIVTGGPAMNC
jgi:hypothetical protein